MKILIPGFAAFGPLILVIGVRSVGAIGFGFALIGGFMITAALFGVFHHHRAVASQGDLLMTELLASQAKEIEILKKRLAGDEPGEVS